MNGEDLRKAFERDFEPETPAETVILDRACALLDQIAKMEEQLETSGYVSPGGNNQPVASPLLAAIRAHSAEVSRLVRQLKMEPEDIRTTRARTAANARWQKA
jgi:hypothetical protein